MKKIAVFILSLIALYSIPLHTSEKKNEKTATIRYIPCCPPAPIAVPPCYECYFNQCSNRKQNKQMQKNSPPEKKEPHTRSLP